MSWTEQEMNVESERSRKDREKINEVALLNERHFLVFASSILVFSISTFSLSRLDRQKSNSIIQWSIDNNKNKDY